MKSRTPLLALIVALLLGCSPPATTDAGMDARIDAVMSRDVVLPSDGPPCSVDQDCDDLVFCDGVERCMPGSPYANRRGCIVASPATACRESQTCDESARRCRSNCGQAMDADGDGHSAAECGGDDCDDADPQRFPGNTEYCDTFGHDEDCDATTYGFRDQDNDSYGDGHCCNTSFMASHCGLDCDDTNPRVHPNVPETCDGLDNDCNGMIDDGVASGMSYPDHDGDGYGDHNGTPSTSCSTPGYVANDTDCNDNDATVHPMATETCDRIDSNCSSGGGADTTEDADNDMFAPVGASCTGGFPATDCDDSNPAVHPGAPQTCNGVDDDCSHGGGSLPSEDLDGDHYSAIGAACTGGYPRTDCNDAQIAVHPGSTEVCDGADNDCNTRTDEGCPNTSLPPTMPPTDWSYPYPSFTPTHLTGGTIVDCPANQVAVGIAGWLYSSPTFGLSIVPVCVAVSTYADTSVSPYLYELRWNGTPQAVSCPTCPMGTSFATYAGAMCPTNQFVNGFNNFGSLEKFRVSCMTARFSGSGGFASFATWQPTIGNGASGGTLDGALFGLNQILAGFNLHFANVSGVTRTDTFEIGTRTLSFPRIP